MSIFLQNNFAEIQNFFDDPDLIRNIGLHCDYNKCNFLDMRHIYSGVRSQLKYEVIHQRICNKIEVVTNIKIFNLSIHFHLNPILSCFGAPHHDGHDPDSFAGVIYLNDQIPDIDCGTTLYFEPFQEILENQPDIFDMQLMYSLDLPFNHPQKINAQKKFLEFKKNLKVKQNFKNEYNKLVMYKSNIFHSPDFYFGNNLTDSRMTIVFHGKLK